MVHQSTKFNGHRSVRSQKQLRARVTAAFRNIAGSIDARTAQYRSWDFYLSRRSASSAAAARKSGRSRPPVIAS
jgi:hypothetical protein